VNRRQFLAGTGALGIARSQVRPEPVVPDLPDMLLNYFAHRLEEEAARWDRVRAGIRGPGQVLARNRFVREKLRQLSGPYPASDPARSPPGARVVRTTMRPGYRIENVMFQSRPDFWVTANLYVPLNRSFPAPAIVMPRGHFNAERMSGDYQQICFDFVHSGCVVLSYDPIGQGERRQHWTSPSDEFDSLFSTNLEHALIGNLLALMGESSAGYFIRDGMRAVDYLLTRPEVDPKRIGCADHSDNGSESVLFCALDERIACAALHAPNAGHRWPIDRKNWIFSDDTQEYLFSAANYGIDIFDTFTAVAPRPLLVLIENKEGEFAATAESVRLRYEQLGEAAKFAIRTADSSVDWPKKLRLDTVGWFARWFRLGAAPGTEADVVPEMRPTLACTPQGSLRRAGLGKSIYVVIRAHAEKLSPPIDATLLRAELRRTIARPAAGSKDADKPRILNSEIVGGIRKDRLLLPSEPGIWLPSDLYRPDKPNGKIIVYVAGDVTAMDPDEDSDTTDEDKVPADRTAQTLAAKNYTVLSVDVRGMGATSPRLPRRGFRVPFQHLLNRDMALAFMAWSIGDSLPAMRTRDVLRAVDHVSSLGEVWVAGNDMGAIWALFAAAVDPRIHAVILQNGLVSWRELLEHDRYQQASSQFIWGALTKFDLPQVASLIAPRVLTILNPADYNKQPVTAVNANAVYAPVLEAYRSAGASGNLSIAFGKNIADFQD
jgi:cephalosporin-C deacetylase-like acetyl esterase